MARKGRNFELAYKWLYDLNDKYHITSPAFLYDKASDGNREVDVLIEYNDAKGFSRKLAIECRDRKSVQDVMWIEQLIQKKEDLGLDYIIATTTTSFTTGAINKAKYHGVIIEQAELLNAQTVESNIKNFFFDIFFFKLQLQEFNLYLKNKGKLSFKDFLKTLSWADQCSLMKELNTNFYYSIDPSQIIDEHNIETKDFFSNKDNSIFITGHSFLSDVEVPECMNNVLLVDWKIRVIPIKVSLPISDSISVFDGETHSNKDYRAVYGNNEDFFRIGYLNGTLFTEISLKPRKFLRFTGANLELNTIIPDDVNTDAMIPVDYIVENLMGEFDISQII